MKNLIWQSDNYGWTTDDSGIVYPLSAKPAFSFQFDALYFEPLNQFFVMAGARTELSAAQITEIENFITTVPQTQAASVRAVDARGKYLGLVPANTPNITQVPSAPYSSDNLRWDFNTNFWIKIQAVDKNGVYLGNVSLDDPNFYQDVQSVPTAPFMVWDFTLKAWKDGRAVTQIQEDLCLALDTLADTVALKYVTPGFTQTARYMVKLQQAQAYKADGYPNSLNPGQIDSLKYPYVYWETNQKYARDKTVTGQSLADMVIQQGTAWDAKGAMIEGYRTTGKEAIMAAGDIPTAQAAYDTYSQNLQGV